MGVPEIEVYLSHLVQEGNISASTQNQTFNTILFLYRNVLKNELAAPIHALRAQHLPTDDGKTGSFSCQRSPAMVITKGFAPDSLDFPFFTRNDKDPIGSLPFNNPV